MKAFIVAVALTAAGAFVQASAQQVATVTNTSESAAICHCQGQCDAMWTQATQDIEQASMMRLRIATSSLLETYPTNNANRFTGTVTKTPIGGDSYTIALTLEPWAPGQRDAQATIHSNIANFNARLNATAVTTRCTAD